MRQLTLATRRGWEAAAKLLDPEIEMDTTRLPAPGLAGVYRGPDEVLRFWVDWLEAWGGLGTFEDPELFDAGDQVLAWFSRHALRGQGSGIEVEMPEYGWLATVRDGTVVWAVLYLDKDDALDALSRVT